MSNFIHPEAIVSRLADIEESNRGSQLNVNAKVFIDSFVKIKMAGGSGNIVIDERSYINSGTVLYSGNGIAIGKDVLIAANCTLAPTNHEFSDSETPIRLQGFKASKGGIVIENDVWIGAGCILLDGAIIRKGAVIGALSLIKGEIPAYAIAAGNPPKLIGSRK